MRPNFLLRKASLLLAGLALATAPLPAQLSDVSETSELGTYVGTGFGLGEPHVWVGGTTGISPSKYFMAVLDTSFMPLGDTTLRTGLIRTSTSRLYDFNFGGQILIPVHHRFTPYGLLAAGILYNTYRIAAVRPDGFAYLAGQSDVKFACETGGGVRYFVTEDFGARAEYRFTASTQNFSRFLIGVFYQFGGMWPFRPTHKTRGTPPER
jgi:opacity protein-like surface antigen